MVLSIFCMYPSILVKRGRTGKIRPQTHAGVWSNREDCLCAGTSLVVTTVTVLQDSNCSIVVTTVN